MSTVSPPPLRLRELDEPTLARFAEALGARLATGDLVLLSGPMGAGKTTFVRALARGLGVDAPDRVCSPTFNVSMEHGGPVPLVHIDLYRLGEDAPVGSAAFEALGLGELLDQPPGVVAVEWAEYWASPSGDRLQLRLSRSSRDGLRDLEVQGAGPAADRLARIAAEARMYAVRD